MEKRKICRFAGLFVKATNKRYVTNFMVAPLTFDEIYALAIETFIINFSQKMSPRAKNVIDTFQPLWGVEKSLQQNRACIFFF